MENKTIENYKNEVIKRQKNGMILIRESDRKIINGRTYTYQLGEWINIYSVGSIIRTILSAIFLATVASLIALPADLFLEFGKHFWAITLPMSTVLFILFMKNPLVPVYDTSSKEYIRGLEVIEARLVNEYSNHLSSQRLRDEYRKSLETQPEIIKEEIKYDYDGRKYSIMMSKNESNAIEDKKEIDKESKGNIQTKNNNLQDKKLNNLSQYKEIYLMPDESVKFGYELVDINNSTSNNLVIDKGNGKSKNKVSDSGIVKAMELYQKNEILPDDSIQKIINTYIELIEYDESMKVQNYYQKFLDKKDNVLDSQYFKDFETKQKTLTDELYELRKSKDNYLVENTKIINKVLQTEN